MTYTVENQENYTLVTFSNPDLANATQELLANKQNIVNESHKYLILNLTDVKTVSAESLQSLKDLGQEVLEMGGIFIITHLDDKIAAAAEKYDLTVIPTVEEAVDFVFIEQIEKQFFSDEEPE